jgi:LacI family transcriptional regulator
MATIKEISQLANVSSTTVSRVLNRDESIVVSPEVRNRIFTIAHELHYVPPRMRHPADERRIVIGVADWHIIRSECENIKLSSLECLTKTLSFPGEIIFERIKVDTPPSKAVDGIIAFGSFSEAELESLRQYSFSIVFINSDAKDYVFDRINMDFEEGLKQAVRFLLEKGYGSIGYIGGIYQNGGIQIGTHRRDCFERLLRDANMFDERYFHIGELRRAEGYRMMLQAIDSGTAARAILLEATKSRKVRCKRSGNVPSGFPKISR